jgi:hypothetical protein
MEGLRYSQLKYREAIERGLALPNVALEASRTKGGSPMAARTHGRRKHPSRMAAPQGAQRGTNVGPSRRPPVTEGLGLA